jgi:LysR family glycine cleavage system transcriptional activator
LADYGRTDPELRFHLIAGDEAIDFTEANLDLPVRLADGRASMRGCGLPGEGFVTLGLPDAAERAIAWPGDPARPGAGLTVADAGLALDAAAEAGSGARRCRRCWRRPSSRAGGWCGMARCRRRSATG